jgi:hypothetical protein
MTKDNTTLNSILYVHLHKKPSTYYYAVYARTIDQILTTTNMGTVRERTNKQMLLHPSPPKFSEKIKIED